MTDDQRPPNRAADARNNILRARANKPGVSKAGLSAALPQKRVEGNRPQPMPRRPIENSTSSSEAPRANNGNTGGNANVVNNANVSNRAKAPVAQAPGAPGNAAARTPRPAPAAPAKAPVKKEVEGSYYGSSGDGSVYDDIDIDLQDLFEDDEELEMLRKKRKQKQLNRAKERPSIAPVKEAPEEDEWNETVPDEHLTAPAESNAATVVPEEEEEDLPDNAIKIQNDDGTFEIIYFDDDEEEETDVDEDNLWGEDDSTASKKDKRENTNVDDFAESLEDDDEVNPLSDYELFDDDDNVLDFLGNDGDFAEDDKDEVQPGQSVFRGYDINAILAVAFEEGASDIDIIPYKTIAYRKLGEVFRRNDFATAQDPVPDGRTTREMQQYILSAELSQRFIMQKEVDTSYVIQLERDTLPQYRDLVKKYKGRRLRVSVGHENEDIYMVFRTITDKVPTPQELGIEGDMLRWASLPRGLVLINGSTGSGKSTTLSSLIRQEQLRSRKKFITIEKPVEFMYPDDGDSLIIQREVGKDTHTFESGLNSAMREAPDVILIGEVRDKTEALALLKAADTGHLALSTMHTKDVATTISRVQKIFEGDGESSALASLSDALKGIANQILLKTPDGKSRFAIRETLVVNDEIRKLIADGNAEGVREYQRKHEITMEHELARVAASGKCTVETALIHTDRLQEFDECFIVELLRGAEKGTEPVYELPETRNKYERLLSAHRGTRRAPAVTEPRRAPKPPLKRPTKSLPTRLP